MHSSTKRSLLLGVMAALFAAPSAVGHDASAVLHEPIASDFADDVRMRVTVPAHAQADGREPARRGNGSPSPGAAFGSETPVYAGSDVAPSFEPDRDTSDAHTHPYDEPFSPSNAPYKRVAAFDMVRADGTLAVRDPSLVPIAIDPASGSGEQRFSADLVVDLPPSGRVRIPSVGPSAHVLWARLRADDRDVAFRLFRDGADNWFLEPAGDAAPGRARLTMDVAIDPQTFGGTVNDSSWSSLPQVPPLPAGVEHDAAEARAVIGVSRADRPRAAIERLVEYFRGFAQSRAPEPARRSVYLDLVLSKKGVCRHRAFAFVVTAQSLGIPARMVTNEAHAWVETFDGTGWRRIDLGGAGDIAWAAPPPSDRATYEPPPDPFRWPDGNGSGAARIAAATTARLGDATSLAASGEHAPAPSGSTSSSPDRGSSPDLGLLGAHRPPSSIDLQVAETDPQRGALLHVHGSLHAGKTPCPSAAVEIWLRDAQNGQSTHLGTVATDSVGQFAGALFVPPSFRVGDYEVLARTAGTYRCGPGSNAPASDAPASNGS